MNIQKIVRLLFSTLFIAAGVICNSACQSKTQKTQQQHVYTSIQDLMDSIIDPSADVVWDSVEVIVDKKGIHEKAPKTSEDWIDMRRAAIRIIEGANLLMMPGRHAAIPGTKSAAPGIELEPEQIEALIKKNREAFDSFAQALQAVGGEVLHACEGKNSKLLTEIGGRIDSICESCHRTFWYPNDRLPSDHAFNFRLYSSPVNSYWLVNYIDTDSKSDLNHRMKVQ